MKKTLTFSVLFLAILIISAFSGCIEEKKSAINEITKSNSLINSGNSRLEKIDFALDSSDTRIKLEASKVDYEEALKILGTAITDSDEEKKIIESNKITSSYSLDAIAAMQYFITNIDHFDKANAYMESNNIVLSRSELKLAEDALNKAKPYVVKAKEKIFSIDINTIPSELKSNVIEERSSIESLQKILDQYGNLISGMKSFIDGMENMLTATDYLEKEKWKNAELAFSSSTSNIMKARNEFNSLKTSEFSAISVTVIQIDGSLTELLDALPHFEAGSRYASQGDFVRSKEEFDKVK